MIQFALKNTDPQNWNNADSAAAQNVDAETDTDIRIIIDDNVQ